MENLIETLADLVSIDSVNPEWGGPGEGEVAEYVRSFLERAGIETWVDEVLPGRSNVVGRVAGRDPDRAILLEAHMDTVSVADMTIAPFAPAIGDGRLYGRGACDTKAGLAGMMHALAFAEASGEKPPCDLYLAAVVDEEHAFRGVLGAIEWLEKRGVRPEAAIVAEPTELRAVRCNKGVLRWRIETRGVAAHSSKPHLGKNAIVAMAKVVAALERFHESLADRSHPLLGSATCSIGLIEGGTQVNFVPERCAVTLDRRMLPGETAESVLADYEGVLSEFPPGEVIVHPPLLSDEAMETPADAAVVRKASALLDSLGLDPEPAGVPFGCDCTKLARAGIPSLVFGPGSIDRAHGAIEYVELEQVELAFDFYRRFLMEYGI
ncbi:MAG: M20 family metallopeptidase [Verrucomicrobiales bacterium]